MHKRVSVNDNIAALLKLASNHAKIKVTAFPVLLRFILYYLKF